MIHFPPETMAWIAAARPKTLPAAVAPVAVGSAEAFRLGFLDWWPVSICLVFALLVQVATNFANDYFDYIRGADTKARIGPERLVASGRIAPRSMLRAAVLLFGVAFCLGLTMVAYRGWEMLLVGILSILFGYAYTGGPFPLAYHGLGDLFVVAFFGLVATGGSFYVITGYLEMEVFCLGLALGLLANNILVVNNYRDQSTDAAAGKRTLVVRFGGSFAVWQYRLQFLAAYFLIEVFAWLAQAPWSLLALLSVPWAFRLAVALPETGGRQLNVLLGRTAKTLLAFSFLLLLGLALDHV